MGFNSGFKGLTVCFPLEFKLVTIFRKDAELANTSNVLFSSFCTTHTFPPYISKSLTFDHDWYLVNSEIVFLLVCYIVLFRSEAFPAASARTRERKVYLNYEDQSHFNIIHVHRSLAEVSAIFVCL